MCLLERCHVIVRYGTMCASLSGFWIRHSEVYFVPCVVPCVVTCEILSLGANTGQYVLLCDMVQLYNVHVQYDAIHSK